ncbi:MAG: hypothetical protein HWD59_03525 [Coxiellaceae bacterium]|nr:MAG: hypothetical protein HWD59_03525 [Coxiellaceae bacterium]
MKTLKEASSDKERFSIATKYLRENNSDAYADALRKALWPDSLANS